MSCLLCPAVQTEKAGVVGSNQVDGDTALGDGDQQSLPPLLLRWVCYGVQPETMVLDQAFGMKSVDGRQQAEVTVNEG